MRGPGPDGLGCGCLDVEEELVVFVVVRVLRGGNRRIECVLFGEAGGFFFSIALPLAEENFFQGLVVWGGLELGFGGEGAVGGVFDDLVDGFGERAGGGFGEVERGDLQAVEEKAGSFGVEVVRGDALDDLADGELDGGAVFERGQGEAGLVAAAGVYLRLRDGAAGSVVEVAKYFLAERRASAAMT